MKKVLLVSVFFFLSLFVLPKVALAEPCCDSTGDSQYQYQYDPSNGKCYISGPQGRVYVDSNCTGNETCNTSTFQCEVYQEPQVPSGCSTNSGGKTFCVNTPYNYTIYCSTQAECNQYKADLEKFYPSIKEVEAPDPTCKDGTGIDTAIGCIPISDTNAFIGFILRWAIGVGGGIAFLLIAYSAFMIMTSQGNPERLKAGQELLTSAIAGLIMLIFSVFILRIIGVDILKLPGFG